MREFPSSVLEISANMLESGSLVQTVMPCNVSHFPRLIVDLVVTQRDEMVYSWFL